MMTAMKEYCQVRLEVSLRAFSGPGLKGPQSYNNTDGQSKANYISFCSHTVTALGTATGGQVNERTVPALKALNNVLYPR